MDIFRTLIVTAADAPLARMIAASFGPGGRGMWMTRLSANGAEPATHFISSGGIPAEFAGLLEDPAAVWAVVTAQGVECKPEEVEALFLAAEITDEPPFTVLARLGLTIINPPMEASGGH